MQRLGFIITRFVFPVLLLGASAWAFTTGPAAVVVSRTAAAPTVLEAGGFEWEDPTDERFDQGVENPFKNPELMKAIKSDGDGDDDGEAKTIDPARLLGPRLQGSNLYLVGMMGSGKSSVGDKLARRK